MNHYFQFYDFASYFSSGSILFFFLIVEFKFSVQISMQNQYRDYVISQTE